MNQWNPLFIREFDVDPKPTRPATQRPSRQKRKSVKQAKTRVQSLPPTRSIAAPEYERYMQSQVWSDRRQQYYVTHERKCVVCSSAVRVELHHLTYDRLGREPDGDLMPLCQRHHAYVHEFYQKVRIYDLRAATLKFVAEARIRM